MEGRNFVFKVSIHTQHSAPIISKRRVPQSAEQIVNVVNVNIEMEDKNILCQRLILSDSTVILQGVEDLGQ